MCRIILLLLPIFIFFGTSGIISAIPSQDKNLHILVTSDLHSWLSTTMLYPGKKPRGLLHIAPIIQDLRKKDTLLLDGGDLISGSPNSYFNNFCTPDPISQNSFFKLFKELKYDAVVVGNHDLDFFPILKNHYLPASNFTWLSANVIKNNHPYFQPYKIIKKDDLKIAIIGLTTAYSKMWISPNTLDGITIESSLKSLNRWLKHLKHNEKPDIIIGLFHLSLNSFRGEKAGKMSRIPSEENVETILDKTTGLNLVISGHDHRLHPYRSENKILYIKGIPVIRGGSWGNAVIELNLHLKKLEGAFQISDIKHQIIFPKKNKKLKGQYQTEVGEQYRQFLFKKPPLKISNHTLKEVQACINQVNAIANDLPNLDGSLLPKAKIRSKLTINGIQRKDIFSWFPYLNKGMMVNLSQRDIERLLSGKGDRRKTFENIFFRMKKGIELIPKRKVTGFFEKNRKRYRMLISDYHFWGGSGWFNSIFPDRTQKNIEGDKGNFLRENLIDYLIQKRPLPSECFFISYQN